MTVQTISMNQCNADGTLVAQTVGSITTRYTQDLAAPLSQILADGTQRSVSGSPAERLFAQSDSNADGRMSPDEWDQRIGGLLNERDQRLYNRSYDLDRSGRVETGELVSYLDWYRAGSMRADINYDGVLDGRDLETMAGRYQSQGG